MGLAVAVNNAFYLIYLILLVFIICTWIPSINWYNEPFKSIRAFSEIFFAPFRKLIPPIGGLDISPIFAFIVLSIIRNILVRLLIMLGL